MSIPLLCSCGRLIGESNAFFPTEEDFISKVSCPGNHPEPTRTEKTLASGLVKRIRVQYPETGTSSSWDEYVGPKYRFLLWIAIMFSGFGVLVENEWVWWKWGYWFFGEGYDRFMDRPKPAT